MADLFTKPLARPLFDKHSSTIVRAPPAANATLMMVTRVRRSSFSEKYPTANSMKNKYHADGYDSIETEDTFKTGRRKYFIEFYKKVNGTKQLIAIHVGMRLVAANNHPYMVCEKNALDLEDSPVKSTQNSNFNPVDCDYSPLPYPSDAKESSQYDAAPDADEPVEAARPMRTSRRPARRFSPSDFEQNAAAKSATAAQNAPEGLSSKRDAPLSSFRPHEGPGIVARAPRPTIKCVGCNLMSDEQISFLVCSACACKNFIFSCGCVRVD